MNDNISENEILTEIRVVNNISFTVPDKKRFFNTIPLIAVALMGLFGTVFSFFSMYETGADLKSTVGISVIFFVVFTVIFMLPRKFSFALIPLSILWGILLWRNFAEFVTGFKMLYNRIYEDIYPDSSEYFDIENAREEYMEIFLAFVIFVLAFTVCYSVLCDSSFILGFITTFLVLETGLFHGKSPDMLFAFMVILYWISLLIIKYCGYYQNVSKLASGFTRRDNLLIARPGIRFRIAGLTVVISVVICCIIFLMTSLISSITGYRRSENVNTIRSNMKFAADEFSLENLGESLERFSEAFAVTPYKAYTHKLGITGAVNFKNKCELTVTADDAIDTNVYLKGYTGAVYTGDEWVDFPDYIYDNREEMFDSFYQNNTFPQDMLTNYFFNRYDLYYVNMNIKSEYEREKYNYIPYISVPDGEITYSGDTQTTLENKQDYNFRVNKLQLSKSNLTDVLSGLDYSINDEFDEYTEFVYDNYCELDQNSGLDEVYKKFVRGTLLETDADIYEKLEYIREFLSENASYTLKPGRTPADEDFVKYFLVNSHKGFCMHYATAGVVLARMSGIPARYCDGYVIHADDFSSKNRQSDGTYKIEIHDNRAHAWAEIYIENLGWVPYEFTGSSAALGMEDSQPETTNVTTTAKKTTQKPTTKKYTQNKTSDNSVAITESEQIITTETVQQNKVSVPLFFKLMLVMTGIVVLISAFIILRYYFEKNRKYRNLNSDDTSHAVTVAYGYILEILSCCNVQIGNMQYLEFADYAEKQLPEILEGKFKTLTQKVLKAQLSNQAAEKEDALWAAEYYKEIFDKVYSKSNILRKAYMKFIKIL